MHVVYTIKSLKDSRIYVGMSKNLKRRLNEHNTGKVFSTKGYVPWKLIFTEEVKDRIEARSREKYYKGGSRKEFLKSLVAQW